MSRLWRKRRTELLVAGMLGALGLLAAGALGGGGAALAVPRASTYRVFINGVDTAGITGHTGRTFNNVTATFDVAGNVYLDISGFAVVDGSSAAAGTAAPKGSGRPIAASDLARIPVRFYLIAEVPRPGFAGYDIEIWINGAYIGIFKDEDGPLAVDVHEHIKPGKKNTLKFRATKKHPKKRRSTSKDDFIKLELVEGRLVRGSVLPESHLFEYVRSAADFASSTTEYEVELLRR